MILLIITKLCNLLGFPNCNNIIDTAAQTVTYERANARDMTVGFSTTHTKKIGLKYGHAFVSFG